MYNELNHKTTKTKLHTKSSSVSCMRLIGYVVKSHRSQYCCFCVPTMAGLQIQISLYAKWHCALTQIFFNELSKTTKLTILHDFRSEKFTVWFNKKRFVRAGTANHKSIRQLDIEISMNCLTTASWEIYLNMLGWIIKGVLYKSMSFDLRA